MTTLLNAPAITISDVTIFQDAEGRYCLNDLHKAAGGEQRHRPKYWLENQQTIDLILQLSKPLIFIEGGIPPSEKINDLQPVVTIKGFGKQGTFVVKELVYAYAMWISPSFHLKVIRTFDVVMMTPQKPPETLFHPFTHCISGELAAKVFIAESAARILRMSDTSKIRMLTKIAESENINPNFLPAYVDEPLVKAITTLLKEMDHPLGHHVAKVVNPTLEKLGILEHLSRKGRGNEMKQFWNLTAEGLQYGRNETSPNNPRETQPLFFVDRFPELLQRLETFITDHALLSPNLK